MQGYLTFILITCHIITMGLSDSAIEESGQNSADFDTSVNRRKLPIFPKNNMKFVITPKPLKTVVYTHKPKGHIMPKITLMPMFTPKPKDENSLATQFPKRKPLMKLRTFTIKSLANGKFDEIEKDLHNEEINQKSKVRSVTNTVIKVLVDSVTDPVPNENRPYFANINDKFKQQIQDKDSRKNKEILEEEKDRNEFIFLENTDQKLQVRDIVDSTQDLDYDVELTTDLILTERAARLKRNNINIIEEENIASTVSVFKYTGRDSRLNNNLYFKNINS